MSFSEPFINRPVATTLLTIAIALAGAVAYKLLPVASLPQVEFPVIQVSASFPGASPETMASAVATPLERQFGRIAGVNELNSTNTIGNTTITLQFDLNRNIDAAARDVEAAIRAAHGQLPSLPTNPTYRKVNPADAPIMVLALSSKVHGLGVLSDVATTILQIKLSQLTGIGAVLVQGGSLPAVRVTANPALLTRMGISLEDVRKALAASNVSSPKGSLADERRSWMIDTSDQLHVAREYRDLVVAHRNGATVRLSDVALVDDAVEDVRQGALANGEPAVMILVFRQPGANIIETVDSVKAVLPRLKAAMPAAVDLEIMSDRRDTISAAFNEVQKALVLSVVLVILVVFVFIRDPAATLIPAVAVPTSLVGTLGVMYLLGFSLNNLSLMALAIATGFVVDDAIIVVDNVARHLESGLSPREAALKGAAEIGFTVISMSLSLIAVFIPILLMGGIIGRLFREFAVTLAASILVSLFVSLASTPMMCAKLLRKRARPEGAATHGLWTRAYSWVLGFVIRHGGLTMLLMLATIALTAYLSTIVPSGFFPQQDAGRLSLSFLLDQQTSYDEIAPAVARFQKDVRDDPAVKNVFGYMGGPIGAANVAKGFVILKSPEDRKDKIGAVLDRVRKKTATIAGADVKFQAVQDLRVGGLATAALYQFTLYSDTLEELDTWAPKVAAKLMQLEPVIDVRSDQQDAGLQAALALDREAAARLGITAQLLDDTLYDAFGQRQVSTTYLNLNQYHVVFEVAPRFRASPDGLSYISVGAPGGTQVPLASIARYRQGTTFLAVQHASQFPAVTISFNLKPGHALGDAVAAIEQAVESLGLPDTIHGGFQGTALAFQAARADQPYLILAAVIAVYIVLGILYESLVHPITILSTLPSAGVGALIALLVTGKQLDAISLMGILLLIGIVKKNAILIIDFALEAERERGIPPEKAIVEACLLRFRPITMTTMAAIFGAVPLAFGTGAGSELRQPLGIAVIGGLVVSQVLTLLTTPVVYLYLDRLRKR